jgi:hypothetical protein
MEYLLHKDFQEIAQKHALQTNEKMHFEFDQDYTFYDSFLFAETFLSEKRKLILFEIEKLKSIKKRNDNQDDKLISLEDILDNEFWFINGLNPNF